MAKRVAVFIDAQNMYQGARTTFFGRSGSHTLGQFDPRKFGELVCQKAPVGGTDIDRALVDVRVYTGRPDSSKDPRSYGAHMRQSAAWEKRGVIVRPRTLRYPFDWPSRPAEEKGVDVALAIDFVTMAVDGTYDIGVIASTDTDLRPAIEYVIEKTAASAEVAAWIAGPRAGLTIPGIHLWCHRLSRNDYDLVADPTDYNIRPQVSRS
ncbi:MAG: NYN domain-containing protein [Dehalococcoidia bacterium]